MDHRLPNVVLLICNKSNASACSAWSSHHNMLPSGVNDGTHHANVCAGAKAGHTLY